MIQVVKTDRKHMTDLSAIFDPIINQLKIYFSRVNHIYFNKQNAWNKLLDTLTAIQNLKFQLGVQSYSNIGVVCYFDVDVSGNNVIPDPNVEREIYFNLTGDTRDEDEGVLEDYELNYATTETQYCRKRNEMDLSCDNSSQSDDSDSDYEMEEEDEQSCSDDETNSYSNLNQQKSSAHRIDKERQYSCTKGMIVQPEQ